ncbi:MAG: hypothetical protein Q9207_004582 [Kuettlingeria erythrocarpa]
MSLEGTHVLVIGGCGFLGHHVVSRLLETSARISVLDLRTDRHRFAAVTYYRSDITDSNSVRRVIETARPEAVIHTASPVVADFSGKVEAYTRVNVLGTQNVLRACTQIGCVKAFIYTSSASVIHDGISDLVMADESYPILSSAEQKEPHNLTKGVAERLVLDENGSSSGMLTTAIRPVSMFGEGDVQQLPNLLQVYYDGRTKVQIGDNKKWFDFVYVGNVAHAHVLALKKLLEVWTLSESSASSAAPQDERVDGEAFFVTNNQPLHFWDYARMVWAAAGDTTDPKDVWVIPERLGLALATILEWVFFLLFWGTRKPAFSRQKVNFTCMNRTFSTAKIQKRLGYEPLWSLAKGIEKGVRWFQEESGKDKKTQ